MIKFSKKKIHYAASLLIAFSVSFNESAKADVIGPDDVYVSKTDGQKVLLHKCFDHKGKRVPYLPFSDERKIAFAFMTYNHKKAAIYINKDKFPHYPKKVIQWIAAHECAHHRLAHLPLRMMAYKQKGFVPLAIKRQQEREADCDATKFMSKKYDFGIDDLKVVFETLDNNTSIPSPEYGTSSDRLKHSIPCLVK